jgi:hypothetical protein
MAQEVRTVEQQTPATREATAHTAAAGIYAAGRHL